VSECTERPAPPIPVLGDVFWSGAWRGPPRSCVWCGRQCWDEWQECNAHSRNNPWRGRAWQRMVARLETHKRWDAQYVRRHPEHANGLVWTTLRAERLRWVWSGGSSMGWKPDFARLWGRLPGPPRPLAELLRRAGYDPERVASALTNWVSDPEPPKRKRKKKRKSRAAVERRARELAVGAD
jgi:hypothetical protein